MWPELIASIPSPEWGRSLRLYGIMIAIGVIAGIELARRRWLDRGGDPEDIYSVAFWAVPAGLIGARLYHVVTDNQLYRDPKAFLGLRWGAMLQIWEGGLGIPGGIAAGVLVGVLVGRSRGMRLPVGLDVVAPSLALAQAIGTIGVIGGTTFLVAMYLSSGWPIWLFAALAAATGGLTIPALGVYQSELFPTGSRGLANGGLALLGVIGGVIGLRVAGVLSEPEHFGGFGPVMAILAIGPAIVAVIVVVFYPETAHTELEVLNPDDAPLPTDPAALAALDATWTAEHAAHREDDSRP